MKKIFLFLFPLFLGVYAFPQKYVKVWSDEFNTPGLPDSTKWDYEVGLVRNTELQYYTYKRSENARIQDTVLIIEARKESYKGSNYTSASLISKFNGDWLYGKFEISAKVPTGKGTWPAIWMMPTYSEYGGWPRSGEIDIMEYVGMNPSNLYFTSHFGTDINSGHKSSGSNTTQISSPYTKYIKFTLYWTPDKLEWFANGIKYHTYSRSSNDPAIWPFNKMFYMILNLAYGGKWGAQQGLDDALLPHKFYIDYVRVYQLQESTGPFSLSIDPASGGTVEVVPKLTTYPEGTSVTLTAKPDSGYEFDKWLHVGSVNPFTLVVSKNLSMIPLFKKKNELILNGDFSLGMENWGNLYFYNAQNNKATASVIDGVYTLNITNSGTANWHIVDQQFNLPFVQGVSYKITFEAWSENPGIADVFISKNYGDYGNYYSTTRNISAVKQSFSWTQKMDKASDFNCRFGFGFGKFIGKVYLDNVSIEKVIPTVTPILPEHLAGFIIRPNPTSAVIEISNTSLQGLPVTAKLYNLHGQLISTLMKEVHFHADNTARVNLNELGLQKGIYFVKIFTPEGSGSQKIVFR